MEFESKLIPILREGVTVIKMIFYKKLKDYLSGKYPERDTQFINQLAGAIVSDIFDTGGTAEPLASFQEENAELIEAEVSDVGSRFKELRIPLTDALRVQFLCDSQEGIDSSYILNHGRDTGILILDREVPLPRTFMELVRKLGVAFGILIPQTH